MEVWIKKLLKNAEINTRNQNASLKNLETQIKQLTKEIHSGKTLSSSSGQIKIVTANQDTETESDTPEALQHQLPPKELKPRSFTLPCMINMSKKIPLGIVENVLVKIDKFLFPFDFIIIDNTPSETMILGRPFLATIQAEIDVFAGKFSLGIDDDRLSFDIMRKDHNPNNSAIVNNPTHRSFDDYKWEFNLEIDKLADEYQLRIGKKGHILDNIWEYCNQVHNKNYEWNNYEFENKECEEIRIEDKDYHPPKVQVETFEVKKYSFKGGQSFICVTKDLDNILPLGRKNGS
ncbi:RNA-directed DNA polymerase, eukaryota, reverse transcriptase zinc-binding domain protein [Tanacetum coccineum]